MRPLAILLFPLIVGLAAQISFSIPLSDLDIPITGQTLAILCLAMLVKPYEALVGILLYIVLGIVGVPVFSDLGSGWEAFSGNSLGYFVGFVVASYVVSVLGDVSGQISVLRVLLLQLFGTFLILELGFVVLCFNIGINDAFVYGVRPFLIGGVVKILLGTFIVIVVDRIFVK